MTMSVRSIPATASIETRVTTLDWPKIAVGLQSQGWICIRSLLSPSECRALIASYEDDALFRSRIVVARHGHGRGEHKHFSYPLPDLVARLRTTLYARLVGLANVWQDFMPGQSRFPEAHADYVRLCHEKAHTRPMAALARYGAGDHLCLQEVGEDDGAFPLQASVLLSEPESEFVGGEFVLTEQQPRARPRVDVVPLRSGDAVVFAANYRPLKNVQRSCRVSMRRGVSTVRRGHRHALEVSFHDSGC